jgi:hypothetical protein
LNWLRSGHQSYRKNHPRSRNPKACEARSVERRWGRRQLVAEGAESETEQGLAACRSQNHYGLGLVRGTYCLEGKSRMCPSRSYRSAANLSLRASSAVVEALFCPDCSVALAPFAQCSPGLAEKNARIPSANGPGKRLYLQSVLRSAVVAVKPRCFPC